MNDAARPPCCMHVDAQSFRFCPVCGGGLEPRLLKPREPERLVCTACGFVLYLDPKIAVGTIIRLGDRGVVLVRRAIEPGYGKWVFPGGYVDRGEEVLEAAVREAREESGLEITVEGLVNVYSYAGRTPIIIVYAASAAGGSLCVDDECIEARVFVRDEIPWDELAFRSTREALIDYFDGRWTRAVERQGKGKGTREKGKTSNPRSEPPRRSPRAGRGSRARN